MSRVLQFSISPVQDFIARSRRTRDLLCSSFLLSYLSGQAMMRVIEKNGSIQFPIVHQAGSIVDDLLRAIQEEGRQQKKGPWIGSLPNRFQAVIPDHFEPTECVIAIKEKWQKIANVVWQQVVEPIADMGKGTREIWERQVERFWEIHWVIGEEADLLRRRKYWREFVPAVKERRKRKLEEGDKCMLFPYLQELSGYTGVGRNPDGRRKQRQFWEKLRATIQHERDLGENERLSAIGMIKRFFPIYAKEAIGWSFPDEVRFFPSVSCLASLPWRKKVLFKVPKEAEQYANEAKNVFSTNLNVRRFFPNHRHHPWVLMDHQAIQRSNLESYPKLKAKFKKLCREVESEPDHYYALLLMDGDQMGELLKIPQQSKRVSQALADFTQHVPKIVQDTSGVLIYAGGDDVFALFPSDRVFQAAIRLRERYQHSFRKYAGSIQTASISASIVFASQGTSFQQVIPYAHQQLDQIAKEKHGRNSLVVSVYNRSGEIVHWAAPWEKAIHPDHNQIRLEVLAKILKLSQSYLHQCKLVLEPLSRVLRDRELREIAVSEWERIYGQEASENVREAIMSLVELGLFMRHEQEHPKGGRTVTKYQHQFSANVAQLIAWLRQRVTKT